MGGYRIIFMRTYEERWRRNPYMEIQESQQSRKLEWKEQDIRQERMANSWTAVHEDRN